MNAPDRAKEIRGVVAAAIGFLTALWGWAGWAVMVWAALILIDYITGSMAAKREKNWSSAIARDGLWHKAGEIFAVLTAALCDIALKVVVEGSGITFPFEISMIVTPIVLLWYILTEAGSIIENCGRLGAPVPSWFKKRVDTYKQAIDKAEGAEEEPPIPEISGEVVGKHEKTDE
jgi:toxin secretion/phage lysis holin